MKCINKVLIVGFLLFSLSAAAQNLHGAADLYQENQYWHDAFYSTDCSIPEDTQILHYPMMHQSPISDKTANLFKTVYGDIKEVVSLSQWRLLQLHRRYPEALVFGEQFWSEAGSHHANENSHKMIESFLNSYSAWFDDKAAPLPQNSNERILTVLNRMRNAKSFEELGAASKKVLYKGGGLIAALGLGFIDQVYPSTLLSSHSEVFSVYWESISRDPAQVSRRIRELVQESINTAGRWHKAESEEERRQIKESFRILMQEKEYLSGLRRNLEFQWRESLLRESVIQVLNQDVNKDKMVIISYGAVHDFSDEFEGYNFYRLPFSCSFLDQESSVLNIIFGWSFLFNTSFITTMSPSQRGVFRSFIAGSVHNLSDSYLEPMLQIMLDLGFPFIYDEIGSAPQLKESLTAQAAVFTAGAEERWEFFFQHYISMMDEDKSHSIGF